MADSPILLSHIGAFVPFPTMLLDEHMPRLKDTEFRLLVVVVRQTLGWQNGSGRKRRDWMSQKQLMARTGRNSAALSAALNVLVSQNLIECCDGEGQLLLTRQQRRRHRGRVYFALSESLLSQIAPTEKENATPPAVLTTPHHRLSGIASLRGNQGWSKASEIVGLRAKSEVRKAKRTKETQNKKDS
ncbi:hypothetical protein IAD21_06015 [Abditibacteriota bacterium]|nr:hypothetical protein IAD21_06015 [Abditibacteriota bacterium]